jgi:predicted ATPase
LIVSRKPTDESHSDDTLSRQYIHSNNNITKPQWTMMMMTRPRSGTSKMPVDEAGVAISRNRSSDSIQAQGRRSSLGSSTSPMIDGSHFRNSNHHKTKREKPRLSLGEDDAWQRSFSYMSSYSSAESSIDNDDEEDEDDDDSVLSGGDDETTESLMMTDFKRQSTLGAELEKMVRRPSKLASRRGSASMQLQQQQHRIVEELTINKLRFASIGLYGRDDEKLLLEQKLKAMEPIAIEKRSSKLYSIKKQLVLISGMSGTGKSSLAGTIQSKVASSPGVYLTGKFDLYVRFDTPYMGFVAACRELMDHISRFSAIPSKRQLYLDIIHQIKEKLGAELGILTHFLPPLNDLLGDDGGNSDGDEPVQQGGSQYLQPLVGTLEPQPQPTPEEPLLQQPPQPPHQGGLEAKKLFHFAFRQFIRIISSGFLPLVLVLDDLQWADPASLELLEVLITDKHNTNLMVIGCYRSSEVDETHALSLLVVKLQEKATRRLWQTQSSFEITQIKLGNLSVQNVHAMICDLLNTNEDDDKRTQELAQICHKKTHGNVFFLIHFLKMLHESAMLEFSLGLMKWVWDTSQIENDTLSAGNVVDLMKDKMSKLPRNLSQLLQLASCLGSTFSKHELELIWNAENSRSQAQHDQSEIELIWEAENSSLHLQPQLGEEFGVTNSKRPPSPPQQHEGSLLDDVDSLLESATTEGYLYATNDAGQERYRFVHDKIKEAAYSLAPKDDMKTLGTRVGNILESQLSPSELDNAIFVVVKLLSGGLPLSSSSSSDPATKDDSLQRIRLAKLNLQAACKAVEISAFESASKYANSAIDLLPEDRWTRHYKLTLEIYTVAAESEGSCGQVDRMRLHCSEVLKQDACDSWSDKLRAYTALIDSVYISGDLEEAMRLSLDVLRQLGCKFPKNRVVISIATIVNLVRSTRAIKAYKIDDVNKIAIMADPQKAAAMKFLDKFVSVCYTSGSNLLTLGILQNVQWSMQYRLSMFTPPALAMTGAILLTYLSDFEGGTRYAQAALLALEQLNGRTVVAARTMMVANVFVLSWTKPKASVQKELLRTYEIGMQTGDTDSAFWAIHYHILLAFHSGRSLANLEAECLIYARHAEELKRGQVVVYIQLLLQAFLNLRGACEDPLVLTGTAMNQEECLALAARTDNQVLRGCVNALQSQLYMFYGRHDLGSKLAIAMGSKLTTIMPGSPYASEDPFCRAMSLFALARRTKWYLQRQKYQRHAKRAASVIKRWAQKGNPNLRHLDMLLDAEAAALRGDKAQAKKFYESAVVRAARGGFLHHAALANERYGDFLWQDMSRDNEDEARFRLDEAIRFYTEWGAETKPDRIREQYQELWTKN